MSAWDTMLGAAQHPATVTTLGTGFRLAGRIQSGRSAKRQAKRGAAVQRAIGREEAAFRRRQAGLLEGRQRASFAARGVEGGSLEQMVAESARLEELDADRIEFLYESIATEMEARGRAAYLGAMWAIPNDLVSGFTANGRMSIQERLGLPTTKKGEDPTIETPQTALGPRARTR